MIALLSTPSTDSGDGRSGPAFCDRTPRSPGGRSPLCLSPSVLPCCLLITAGAALRPHRPRLGFSFCSLLLSSVRTKDPDVATLNWQKVYQCLRVNNCCDHLHAICLDRFSEAATTEPYRFRVLRRGTMQSRRQISAGGSWLTRGARAGSFMWWSCGVCQNVRFFFCVCLPKSPRPSPAVCASLGPNKGGGARKSPGLSKPTGVPSQRGP